ncbi:MAG: twin-arginine translocase subunit TatC [Clostridia bacterium]|nr:twin-arginine translocase subunit TatC [Clostridia bacterium]
MKRDEIKPGEGIPDTPEENPVGEEAPYAETVPDAGEQNPAEGKSPDPGETEPEGGGDSPEDHRATLLSHLLALRNVLLISVASVGAAFFLVYTLAIDPLMSWIIDPIRARGIEIIYTAMSEALVTKFKVALIAGFIVAFPVIIWQVWGFIKPALYPKEKKAFRVLFFLALLLFLTGVLFCYFAVYTLAVDFFLVAGDDLATPLLSIDKYVGFLFGFIVPFGIAFLLPIALYLTTRMGWTDYKMLSSKRKYIILAIFVMAAILTPPDVVSQVALGVPLCVLYEISVQVARLTKPRERE